jgi:hypothetical protein
MLNECLELTTHRLKAYLASQQARNTVGVAEHIGRPVAEISQDMFLCVLTGATTVRVQHFNCRPPLRVGGHLSQGG